MRTDQLVHTLLESYREGEHCPESLRGKLGRDDGYRAQLGLLAHHVAADERRAGWKVGLTADSIRQMFASNEPVFGYLLQSAGKPGGYRFRFSDLHAPMAENEIMVTLATDLAGPAAGAEAARRGIAT